ncbi:hypothetical protein QR680_003042 [Steinernema hermaphroditum]|uniref:Sugar transporter SWEET1 n=1 Tax=Steinernema hermaphroditum TaxID=289476 RepID=A0AA39H7D0_9BILA|nr:hypothetical protein QR680_003042 [Steinernema hermaphroditum]
MGLDTNDSSFSFTGGDLYPWTVKTDPYETVKANCNLGIMDGVTEDLQEDILMFEEGVTVLNVLSISAIITTVSLFFCGIPICIKIWKQQGVGDISGMPFVTGVLGGVFWLRYGLLKFDLTMIVVNVVGVSLMSAYLIFYYIYSPTKKMISIQIMVICLLMSSMLVIVEFYGLRVIHPLGFVCMTFNILNFGAPLAGLGTVIRSKCTSSLPLPLCLATFLVSSQWCLYGTLVSDVYIITPNGIGMLLAITQLSLFLIFPSTPGGLSVIKMLCGCCCGAPEEDAEARRQSRGTLPQKIHPPQPCSSMPNNSTHLSCENGAFSRSASLGSLGSLDESEFASSQRGILPNPTPNRHFHVQTPETHHNAHSTVTAEAEQFARLRDVDEHERRWSQQQQLSRTNSAPELNQ